MANKLLSEWRELGFYYDFDDRLSVNQWRFYGSKQGLQKLATLFFDYSQNPAKQSGSADAHYGPYSYFKLVTLDHPIITNHHFGGQLSDFQYLSELIIDSLEQTQSGAVFALDQAYGLVNTATAKCFVMADQFDPASLDELIQSNRQVIVNHQWQSQSENLG